MAAAFDGHVLAARECFENWHNAWPPNCRGHATLEGATFHMFKLLRVQAIVLAMGAILVLAARAGADDKYCLIISIDGLKGDWACDPGTHGLELPNITKLAATGIKAPMVGVFPSVTYPSHTTLITGCNPARHGILANEIFEPPTAARSGKWYWDYSAIQVPTLIDAAKAKGWTTAAVSWPVCVGAPVDVNFPEIWQPGNYDLAFQELAKHCKPPDLIPRVLTKYTLGRGQSRDISLTNVARYIVEQYKPRLMLVHLVELDSVQHKHGPDTPEARAEAERSDAHVGEILASYEAAGLLKNTVVAIVSDHGFLPTRKSFHVNVVLTQAGLIKPGKDEKGPAEDWEAVGWNAGGSCSIMLKRPDDLAVLERVRKALLPYTGKPDSPIRTIFDREQIKKMGSNPQAALMLDAGPNYTFGSGRSGPVETDSTLGDHPLRGMHGQMPDHVGLEATFILGGLELTKGVTLARMPMLNAASSMCAILDLDLPTAEGWNAIEAGRASQKQPPPPFAR